MCKKVHFRFFPAVNGVEFSLFRFFNLPFLKVGPKIHRLKRGVEFFEKFGNFRENFPEFRKFFFRKKKFFSQKQNHGCNYACKKISQKFPRFSGKFSGGKILGIFPPGRKIPGIFSDGEKISGGFFLSRRKIPGGFSSKDKSYINVFCNRT